jgi:hypothetical protein
MELRTSTSLVELNPSPTKVAETLDSGGVEEKCRLSLSDLMNSKAGFVLQSQTPPCCWAYALKKCLVAGRAQNFVEHAEKQEGRWPLPYKNAPIAPAH